MAYEWETVHKLTDSVMRYYGFQMKNFPMVPQDIMNFWRNGRAEWVQLVQDVTIFVEFQQ